MWWWCDGEDVGDGGVIVLVMVGCDSGDVGDGGGVGIGDGDGGSDGGGGGVGESAVNICPVLPKPLTSWDISSE